MMRAMMIIITIILTKALLVLGLWLPVADPSASAAAAPQLQQGPPSPSPSPPRSCKVLPGDADWPSPAHWAGLNATLGGALLVVDPRFSVCHAAWPGYNATECRFLYDNYSNFTLRTSHPTDILYPYFEGSTCLPSLDPSTPCTLGGYSQYVVNVSTSSQIGSAIRFAKDRNIRLVIKNTGHDVAGKSTGAGSLSIWTHNLKKLEFIASYESEAYQGPAVRAGAGVQINEYYQFAKDHGVTVVGGECDTVGVAGGYLAGGGHSPVGGLFGMAADAVLEMTAVLASGQEVRINNDTHPDLYWALRGGGGSTFGVVTSVTAKAYAQIPVTVDKWAWNTITSNVSTDTFWKAMKIYYDNVLTIGESGSQAMLFPSVIPATNSTPAGLAMTMYNFFAPNKTPEAYAALTAPMYNGFAALGITITHNVTHHDNFHDGWARAFPRLQRGGGYTPLTGAVGSRLLPAANFQHPALATATLAAARTIFETTLHGGGGGALVFYAQRPRANPGMHNAVNPAYRASAAFVIFAAAYTYDTPPAEVDEIRTRLTAEVMPALRSVTPGGGTYVNEADAREPDFQRSFWGANYARLLGIKRAVDPAGVFYAPLTVGSEAWVVENGGLLPELQTGRLCRVVAERPPMELV